MHLVFVFPHPRELLLRCFRVAHPRDFMLSRVTLSAAKNRMIVITGVNVIFEVHEIAEHGYFSKSLRPLAFRGATTETSSSQDEFSCMTTVVVVIGSDVLHAVQQGGRGVQEVQLLEPHLRQSLGTQQLA